MQIRKISCKNNENNENLTISCKLHENNENHRIPCENDENLANLIISFDNYENHEIVEFHLRIMNIMKII